ncbi:hypothetical protein EI94DRAFT_1788000 [Lactarius quietus]|nr:hypothetical protein EI94DRAFT_1788000 [Lactarius quietus]
MRYGAKNGSDQNQQWINPCTFNRNEQPGTYYALTVCADHASWSKTSLSTANQNTCQLVPSADINQSHKAGYSMSYARATAFQGSIVMEYAKFRFWDYCPPATFDDRPEIGFSHTSCNSSFSPPRATGTTIGRALRSFQKQQVHSRQGVSCTTPKVETEHVPMHRDTKSAHRQALVKLFKRTFAKCWTPTVFAPPRSGEVGGTGWLAPEPISLVSKGKWPGTAKDFKGGELKLERSGPRVEHSRVSRRETVSPRSPLQIDFAQVPSASGPRRRGIIKNSLAIRE